jgi:hypothetical protein
MHMASLIFDDLLSRLRMTFLMEKEILMPWERRWAKTG